MKKIVILLVLMSLLLVACGGDGEPAGGTATRQSQTTSEFKTPLPEATQAKLIATNTPQQAPPTPTRRPPNTTVPTVAPTMTFTPQPTAEKTAGETAQKPTATKVPPTSTATVPPLPPVTDVMVEVPAGPFTMGSNTDGPEDAPAHEVDVPAFAIDQWEVTNADFEIFVTATGYVTGAEELGKKSWRDSYGEGEDGHPVVRVTWNDAAAYCEWVGKRLPTEVEWEKAARGAEALRYPWGNEWVSGNANVKEAGIRSPVAVGSYGAGASPYGADDMAGNVLEWTTDWYQPYPGNSTDDPYYGEQCRVVRGGGWFDDPAQATTFNRNCAEPDKTATDELGFRCVVSR